MDASAPASLHFCSLFSPQDEEADRQLQRHLTRILPEWRIADWYPCPVSAEQVKREARSPEQRYALERADLVIALLSPGLLPQLEEPPSVSLLRRLHGQFVPVLLHPCSLETAPTLSRHALLPDDQRPISTRRDRESAWTSVARALRRLIEEYFPTPRYIITGATIASSGDFLRRLKGLTIESTNDDGSALVAIAPPDEAQILRRLTDAGLDYERDLQFYPVQRAVTSS